MKWHNMIGKLVASVVGNTHYNGNKGGRRFNWDYARDGNGKSLASTHVYEIPRQDEEDWGASILSPRTLFFFLSFCNTKLVRQSIHSSSSNY